MIGTLMNIQHQHTGREQDTKACGSVIVCSRDSPFLLLWLNSYLDDYQEDNWAYNSGQVGGGGRGE